MNPLLRCSLGWLLLTLTGWVAADTYRSLTLAEALEAPPGTYVRVWGWYQPEGDAQALVRGELVSGAARLRVEGQVFDWRPPAGERVEVWGRLEPGPLLRFHNGRGSLEQRRPRPTPSFREGDTVSVWLEVQDSGPAMLPFVQGVTEDRHVFFLPRYDGRLGLVCLRGEVGFLRGPAGERALLRGARRCAAGRP